MTVPMGIDCMLNLLYFCFDSKAKSYDPDPPYKDILHDYYRRKIILDTQWGIRDSISRPKI